jgi:hypothetical protein
MPKLSFDVQNRKRLAFVGAILPPVLLGLYWFVQVGFTDPATRLGSDLRNHAHRARISRVPLTFVHEPINQWTRPMKDFYIRLDRGGQIRIGPSGRKKGRYTSQAPEPVSIGGNFEFRNVGRAVEIELIPAGDTAQVASVRPLP